MKKLYEDKKEIRKVYLLNHAYEYGKNNEHEATKELGIYSSLEKAKEARKRYRKLPGFIEYNLNCFDIYGYELDKDLEWTEGFFDASE